MLIQTHLGWSSLFLTRAGVHDLTLRNMSIGTSDLAEVTAMRHLSRCTPFGKLAIAVDNSIAAACTGTPTVVALACLHKGAGAGHTRRVLPRADC